MNSSNSLILEIQSGLVNAAIVGRSVGQASDKASGDPSITPHIIHSVSMPIPGAPYRDSAHLLGRMEKTLAEVLKALPNLHRVSRVDCILSSPWIISRTKSVRVKFAKETPITKKLVGATMNAEREKMKLASSVTVDKDAAGITSDTANALTFIEQKIFEIKINGYPVADIAGKSGRELEIFFAVSMSSSVILEHINDSIKKYIGSAAHSTYHSSILLGYAASRETSGDQTSYILGHIHGELSDVVVVKKGITTLVASFPFGYSSLIRSTAKALGESEFVARSKIALHSSKNLHREETARISSAIENIARKEWAEQFLKAISVTAPAVTRVATPSSPMATTNTDTEFLPYTVFLAVPAEYYPHFKKSLEVKEEGVKNGVKKEGGDIDAENHNSIFHKAHVFVVNHVNTGLIHTILHL